MALKTASNGLQNRFSEVMQGQQNDSLQQVHRLEDLWPVMREEAQRKAIEHNVVDKEAALSLAVVDQVAHVRRLTRLIKVRKVGLASQAVPPPAARPAVC